MSETTRVETKVSEAKKERMYSQKQNTDFSQSISSPVEQILFLQRTIGNQSFGRLIKSGALQAKPRVGKSDDIYEQDDRVADKVMQAKDGEIMGGIPTGRKKGSLNFQTTPETQRGHKLIANERTHLVQQRSSIKHIARAEYTVGNTKVNINYGGLSAYVIGQYEKGAIDTYTRYTGKVGSTLQMQIKGWSDDARHRLIYALDLLIDNPIPGFNRDEAVNRLITFVPLMTKEPLVSGSGIFDFENEILRASGWFEFALTSGLKAPGKTAQGMLDVLYNPSGVASGTAASSACPATRPPSVQLDEPKLRKDLDTLMRTYVAGQASVIASITSTTQNLSNTNLVADLVQAQALSFFSPFIGRSHTRPFQQGWKYSAHIKSSTATGAIPVEVRRAFLDNRARKKADESGLFNVVHYDPRCGADELVFADIIDKLDTDTTVQAALNRILSWKSFTGHTNTGAEVTLNLQHKASDDSCEARWGIVETLCHELIHVYVSQEFFDMHKNRQLINEGFTEILGDQLYNHIRSGSNADPIFRRKFEAGLSPFACALVSIPSSTRGYPGAADPAEKIRSIVGDSNFRAAYFLGQNVLAGLQPKLLMGRQDNIYEREADAVAEKVVETEAFPLVSVAHRLDRTERVQRQPEYQSPQDRATVAAAKKRLAILEPQLAELEGKKIEIDTERLRVLADRKRLDANAADPAMLFKERGEETNMSKLNRAPLEVIVAEKEVAFSVKFHVRFEDPSMKGRFDELKTNLQAGIDLVWKQQIGGVFAGRSFTIKPLFTLIETTTPRNRNYWLITVRKVSTGAKVAYPGCTLDQPDPSVPTSVTDPMCDGGVMIIPPSHLNKPGVLGHEMLHLFGLIDRYMMLTSVKPGQKNTVTLSPTRNTGGRRDPLGGEEGTILQEDLGYLFDKLGIYSKEDARSTARLGILKREVMRLQQIVKLGYDPNSLIRGIIRKDFNDKMVKNAENL